MAFSLRAVRSTSRRPKSQDFLKQYLCFAAMLNKLRFTPLLIVLFATSIISIFPRYRILRFEKFFDIKKGQPFVWECHDCHEGVVIPGTYINNHGETVKIDPNNLDPNSEVMRFWPLFHDSNIPSFHVGGIKPVPLKATWFQYIIEIPRRIIILTANITRWYLSIGRINKSPAAHKPVFLTLINNFKWSHRWPPEPHHELELLSKRFWRNRKCSQVNSPKTFENSRGKLACWFDWPYVSLTRIKSRRLVGRFLESTNWDFTGCFITATRLNYTRIWPDYRCLYLNI